MAIPSVARYLILFARLSFINVADPGERVVPMDVFSIHHRLSIYVSVFLRIAAIVCSACVCPLGIPRLNPVFLMSTSFCQNTLVTARAE